MGRSQNKWIIVSSSVDVDDEKFHPKVTPIRAHVSIDGYMIEMISGDLCRVVRVAHFDAAEKFLLISLTWFWRSVFATALRR